MYEICKRSGHFLPRGEANSVLSVYDRFLMHYNWLTASCIDLGELRYNFVPKVHLTWHICDHAKFLNPVSSWTCELEDFIGAMIQSAKSCMIGTPLRLAGPKLLDNWLLVFALRIRDMQ